MADGSAAPADKPADLERDEKAGLGEERGAETADGAGPGSKALSSTSTSPSHSSSKPPSTLGKEKDRASRRPKGFPQC